MLVVKNLPASAGDIRDVGSIPGLRRFPGEGHGNPLQYSCLENPVDRGAWWAAVHGVAQSWTWLKQLSMHACIGEGNGNLLQYSCLENPVDRGAGQATVHGVAQSWTWLKWLSTHTYIENGNAAILLKHLKREKGYFKASIIFWSLCYRQVRIYHNVTFTS